MTEVQNAFKKDYAFLEQLAVRNREWSQFKNEKLDELHKSHFLLHPDGLLSDSETECSYTSDPVAAKSSNESNISRKSYMTLQGQGDDFKPVRMSKSLTHNKINTKLEVYSETDCKAPKNIIYEEDEIIISDNNLPNPIIKKRPFIPPARLDNFDKKLHTLIERNVNLVNKIKTVLENGIPPADGEEDLERRTKRLQEFSSRFCRVYLYPLFRQTTDLRTLDKVPSFSLNQKIISIHQIIWQGLQAYYNHLPSSIGKACSDKLAQLLDCALDLYDNIQDLKNIKQTENIEFVNAMTSHINQLLKTIDTYDMQLLAKKVKKRPQTLKLEKSQSRFAMYSMSASFRKDPQWKKGMEMLTKKKLNVKSRYRSAGFKHRPPVEKPIPILIKPALNLTQKKSSTRQISVRIDPIREEDIETMVMLEAPNNSSMHLNHEGNKQVVRDSDDDEEIVIYADKEEKKAESNQNKADDDKVEQTINEKGNTVSLADGKTSERLISISGPKNARLICIEDTGPIVEAIALEMEKHDKEMMTEKEKNSTETQTAVEPKPCVKISRIVKCHLRPLEMLPKEDVITVIQYKFQLHSHRKNNPMYKKTVHVQPWILMGRVSDDILDELLQKVTKELEMNEILENLYNSEFQY